MNHRSISDIVRHYQNLKLIQEGKIQSQPKKKASEIDREAHFNYTNQDQCKNTLYTDEKEKRRKLEENQDMVNHSPKRVCTFDKLEKLSTRNPNSQKDESLQIITTPPENYDFDKNIHTKLDNQNQFDKDIFTKKLEDYFSVSDSKKDGNQLNLDMCTNQQVHRKGRQAPKPKLKEDEKTYQSHESQKPTGSGPQLIDNLSSLFPKNHQASSVKIDLSNYKENSSFRLISPNQTSPKIEIKNFAIDSKRVCNKKTVDFVNKQPSVKEQSLGQRDLSNSHFSVIDSNSKNVSKETKSNKNTPASDFSYQTISIDAIESKIKNIQNQKVFLIEERGKNLSKTNDSNESAFKERKVFSKSDISRSREFGVNQDSLQYDPSKVTNLIKEQTFSNDQNDSTYTKSRSDLFESDSFTKNQLHFPYKPPVDETISNDKEISPVTKYNYSVTNPSEIDQISDFEASKQPSHDLDPQYSIFDSKKQMASLVNMTNSFKESACQIQISGHDNKKTSHFKSNLVAQNTHVSAREEANYSAKPKMKTLLLNHNQTEMSFDTNHEDSKLKNLEEQFNNNLQDFPIDSITQKTQSIDNQPFMSFENIIKSRFSSKDIPDKSRTDIDMSSYVSETDIIKNFEKFDPRGTILRKLIVKFNILTGSVILLGPPVKTRKRAPSTRRSAQQNQGKA